MTDAHQAQQDTLCALACVGFDVSDHVIAPAFR